MAARKNDLIAALQALTAGMAAQQQQQQQAQLQQLAGHQERLRTAATATIPTFHGNKDECLTEWLALLNRVAVAEQWDDANKRRVAVSKLAGLAAQWHDQTGHDLVGWQAWQTQLRAMFEPRISLTEWCLLVETRRQLPGEAGAQYALEKARLCRRCPVHMEEADFVPYLIRGLAHAEHISAILSAPPQTIAGFIDTIRRLEVVSGIGLRTSSVGTQVPAEPNLTELVTALGDQLKETMAIQLKESVRHLESRISASLPNSSSFRPRVTFQPSFAPPPVNYFPNSQQGPPSQIYVPVPRFRAPNPNIECHYCHGLGHIARECPQRQTGNAQAGLHPGQGQQ